MSRTDLAFIILNYKTAEMTRALVDQLNTFGFSESVIVVDNASPDSSGEALSLLSDEGKCTFIQNPKNSGYAAGNNLGLKMASQKKYKYALVLNTDIHFHNMHAIEDMAHALDEAPAAACVSPRIITPGGGESIPCLYRPSAWSLSLGIFAFHRRMKRDSEDIETSFTTYRPQGSCMMLRLSALEKVDFLDERTFLYFEEPILAEKLLGAGYTSQCVGNAKVIHDHSVTTKSNLAKWNMLKIYASSCKVYLKEYRHFNWMARGVCTATLCLSILRRWL